MDLETSTRESKRLDFKQSIDPSSHGELAELIKDIVAMANSGGGVILIGVQDDGSPAKADVHPILTFDPAKLTDKIESFTGEHFCDFEITKVIRSGYDTAALHVKEATFPLVFRSAGTYSSGGKSKQAFAKGTIYFRHGAKSEPATNADIRDTIERIVESRRKAWLSNVRKVMKAPAGSLVKVLPPHVRESTLRSAVPIRIVDDPSASVYEKLDTDRLYPHRQKEVLAEVNRRIGGSWTMNSYDLLCVRRMFNIEAEPKYFHQPKYGSPQYSDTFVDWLVEQVEHERGFFERVRASSKGAQPYYY